MPLFFKFYAQINSVAQNHFASRSILISASGFHLFQHKPEPKAGITRARNLRNLSEIF